MRQIACAFFHTYNFIYKDNHSVLPLQGQTHFYTINYNDTITHLLVTLITFTYFQTANLSTMTKQLQWQTACAHFHAANLSIMTKHSVAQLQWQTTCAHFHAANLSTMTKHSIAQLQWQTACANLSKITKQYFTVSDKKPVHNITLRTCFTKTTILFYTFSLHFQLVFQITLASFYSYRATLSMVPCYSTMIGHSVLQFYKSLSCLYFHIVLQWLAIVLYSEIYFPAVLQRYSPLCLYIHAVLQSLAILFYNFTDLYHAYTSTLFSNDLKFCFIHNSHLFWMSTVLWNDWFYSTVIYIYCYPSSAMMQKLC